MKPVRFAYYIPETLEEALAVLEQHGEDVAPAAGCMSLGPMLNMRLARPKILLDITHVQELKFVRQAGDGVEIGPIVTQAAAQVHPVVQQDIALLSEAINHVGHYQTRSVGTIGGSIAHSDPSAEIPLALVILEGEVELRSRRKRRTVGGQKFFTGILSNERNPDELITCVRLKKQNPDQGYAFEEISKRPGDFALASVAANISMDPDGCIETLRFAVGGVADRPIVLTCDESRGKRPDARLTEEIAGWAAEAALDLAGDVKQAGHRRSLIAVLAERTLRKSCAQVIRHGETR